jgi:hypothetical protein
MEKLRYPRLVALIFMGPSIDEQRKDCGVNTQMFGERLLGKPLVLD